MSYEGRQFTDYENEAWNEYHAILAEYQKTDKVLMYDRVSIHEAFPVIQAAFDKAVSMRTFRLLQDG